MTTKKASRKVKSIENRLSFLETITGYNADGEKNGNGIITLLDNLFDKIKTEGERIDRLDNRSSDRYNELNDKISKLENTLDIIEKQLYNINEQYIKLNNSIKLITDRIDTFDRKMNEHNDLLSDSITSSKIMKVIKGTGIIAGFLMALGTIVGIIAFLYNKIMN